MLESSPFVQRVWITLEFLNLPYQYIEVDPYKKPQALLDVNPRGLVPAIRQGNWGCGESTVLMEYVSDLPLPMALTDILHSSKMLLETLSSLKDFFQMIPN